MTNEILETSLRRRATAVIPGGMYGHMTRALLSEDHPQYVTAADGCRFTGADGREYLDLMCGWGPVVLGYAHPAVRRAADIQAGLGDCVNGASPVMVELAELLVETIPSADWAMFAKNGTDATTTCVTIARAATGRRKVLTAHGAYHGAVPWCTPGSSGVTAEDRAHVDHFEYNDIASLRRAVDRAGDDLAAIVVCPFRHDVRQDQELADPEFARAVRTLCDRTGATMILDDVRAGFRLSLGGSWEPLGVRPDLAAWSKAMANGYALAAVTGIGALSEAASEVYVTGSFWYSAVSMAASIATLTELRETDALSRMESAGQRLRAGLDAQAARHGFEVNQTGPVQMPLLTFAGDTDFSVGTRWAREAVQRGVYLHPTHNWFLSAAHTAADIDEILERTEDAFAVVSRDLGSLLSQG
ncbi:glutamate-1-semialdehyde 2,1-aminomutase [Amycolatopsis orientalis]|uniref:Glutamate-1-semialdehyde 2,1-aminomutase n=1 Tax=Amycolatopsis orientalis TaxID=31958 RepID=A0A193BUT2_AMYOR|nr:aminotransferase class III-fold pyridoxal phosphate-dependent enzyme [Amycolatopsis orientalis]ANN15934.1 glutamate-1-semialdehyde 2,1-aminomutase [Amycolatopsis orientalis]